MRTIANDVPIDIWRIIADLVLHNYPKTFQDLISVNSALFNIVLGERYREVRWVKLDKPMARMLARLQEPLIASHVKRLHIRAWFINYLLKRDALFRKSSNSLSGKTAKWTSALFSTITPVRQRHQGLYDRTFVKGQLVPIHDISSKEIMKAMIKAVTGMVNVMEYNFEWRDLPLNKDTSKFLSSARKAFGGSLRKLVLRAEILKFQEILAITDFEEHLDELDFHFDYTPAVGASQADADACKVAQAQGLLNTIVPFLDIRRSVLRSLAISSSAQVDLSAFFQALGSFPRLRSFSARIWFDNTHLSDPSGLINLLTTHSTTLLNVELKPNWPTNLIPFSTRNMSLENLQISWGPTKELLLSNVRALYGLESLTLHCHNVEKILPLLHRSRDTLTRLSLINRYLKFDEVKAVAQLFSHRDYSLKSLHIEVLDMSADLIGLLATTLRGLLSLSVVFAEDGWNSLTFVFDLLNLRHLKQWSLVNLAVYHGRYVDPDPDAACPPHSIVEDTIMQCIGVNVPSITIFKGLSRWNMCRMKLPGCI